MLLTRAISKRKAPPVTFDQRGLSATLALRWCSFTDAAPWRALAGAGHAYAAMKPTQRQTRYCTLRGLPLPRQNALYFLQDFVDFLALIGLDVHSKVDCIHITQQILHRFVQRHQVDDLVMLRR